MFVRKSACAGILTCFIGVNVLNGIRWSEVLEQVWIENMQNDSNLSWQYFGSQRGHFRMFPGLRSTLLHPSQSVSFSFWYRRLLL